MAYKQVHTVAVPKHSHNPYTLLVLKDTRPIASHLLKNEATIGRVQTADVEIGMLSPIISRKHGRFVALANGRLYYKDLHSTNGSYYRGRKIAEAIELKNNDVITFAPKGNPKASDIRICITNAFDGPVVWKAYELKDNYEIHIGRSSFSSKFNQTISARHALFMRQDRDWIVYDLNSTNGVYVNGHRLQGSTVLRRYDLIRIGDIIFYYTGDKLWSIYQAQAVTPQMRTPKNITRGIQDYSSGGLMISIEERNVFNLWKKKTLLKDIRLTIPNGQFVLILGGSGAGKTTFIKSLMGYDRATGTIKYDDMDIYHEYDKMKYKIGYVEQGNVLRLKDTVYHSLYNAAQMKMPANATDADYRRRVDELLDLFGMQDIKDNMVSSISGGQNRRLNTAAEMAGDPSLLILDEPDSGLDATSAIELMRNLRHIADQGKTVLIISHSPDRVAEYFDKIIVLAKGEQDGIGHLAYYGTIPDAKAFFATETIEGIVKRVNRKAEGGEGRADYYIHKYAKERGLS